MRPIQQNTKPFRDQKPESSLPALLESLEYGDELARYDAAWTLGKIEDRRAIPALVKALQDQSQFVRYEAAWALGKTGGAEVISVLIETLKDKSPLVRRRASEALGEIGDAQTLPLKVLAGLHLTPGQKLDLLEALRRIRPTKSIKLRFPLPPLASYCQSLLDREDLEASVKGGAGEVLREIQWRADKFNLVHVTDGHLPGAHKGLLRPTSGAIDNSSPKELLKASQAPADDVNPKTNLISRLLNRK